jgi:putative transposase
VVSDFIYYHDPVLDKWIGAPEPGNKRKAREFIFRYDPRDISYLIFWDPQLRQYFRIPYRNTAYPRISLWELKAIKVFIKDRGLKLENEEQIFLARKEMQRIEEQARSDTRSRRAGKKPTETRKKRMTKERSRLHKVLPPIPLPSDRAVAVTSDTSDLSSVPSAANVVDDFSHLTPFEER